MHLSIAPHAKTALAALKSQGFEAYIVGGAVRDLLRGINPYDYDIATNAIPPQVKAIFENCIPTGEKHGTITAMIDGLPIEITTYRIDGGYFDARHPESISFSSSLKEDLCRRDFTINAMAYDGCNLIDLFGGRDDLKAGIIKTVGNPEKRFSEDALRILRAFRFASTFAFSIEHETLSASLLKAPLLQKISRERIYSELTKTLCGSSPQALQPLLDSGGLNFLQLVSGDISPISDLLRLTEIRYAAFCRICSCSPKTLLSSLPAPKKITELAEEIYKFFAEPVYADKPFLKTNLKNIPQTLWVDVVLASGALFEYDIKEILEKIEEIILNCEPYLIEMLDISGNDLLSLGFCGKQIGDTLSFLQNAVIQNPDLNQKDKLLELAKCRINS